jgi:hypothetical protein
MPPSQEIKKLKKAHRQRLAAEANAKRAQEFAMDPTGTKRKTEDAGDDAAHDALEAAVAAGNKTASKKKAKKGAAAAAADADDNGAGGPKPNAEEVAAFREEHSIKVVEGTPDPIIRFQDAPFPKKLIAALLKQG